MISYGMSAGTIDLGNDPPLTIGDDKPDQTTPHPHRAVSWRWMGGTVLTGVTSILLMGAALFAALSNPDQFVSLPDAVAGTVQSDGLIFGRKADRMRPQETHVADRQILQVSTVTRQGERDFIKLKPFARVTASLTARGDAYAALVPEYDPLGIFADNSAPEAPTAAPDVTMATGEELYGSAVDGEVAVKVVAFPLADGEIDPSAMMNSDEVEQIVRGSADLPLIEGGEGALAFAGSGDSGVEGDPFSALGVSITPENVSSIAKSGIGSTLDEGYREKIIAVTEEESLRTLFEDNTITGDEADEIIAALSQLVDVSRMRPGQKLRVAYAVDPALAAATALADPNADPGADLPRRPIRVSIYDDGAHQATVARADNNAFVRADEPGATPALFAEAEEEPAQPAGPIKVYDALYQTALEQQIPPPLIDQLIRVFAFDVDYQARVAPGDGMEVFHSIADPADPEAGEPEVLYASITLGGVSKRFYRFRTGDDFIVDYYDAEGHSAKKFLIRKPVLGGRISSNFGYRRHPILGRSLLHSGVDYGGVGQGAPILAAGDGVVEKIGRSSGYGNLIILRHTNGYETYYAHQSKFAKGIGVGTRVRQGQVIGYVGSTGRSTGPHLHYEIRINGKPVDPLRIRLPQGRVLEGDYLTAFESERQRIDTLLGLEQMPAEPTTVASIAAQ